MNKTKREKKWGRWVACVGVMYAIVFTLPAFAHDAAIDTGIDALEELADYLGRKLDDAIKNEDWSGARRALRKWRNLIRILWVLRDAQRQIVFGGMHKDNSIAEAHRDGSIHLHERLREVDPRVIAQHLAHEAAHLAHQDKRETLDGEVLAWQKEEEVWTEFKRKAYGDGEPTLRDYQCDTALLAVIRGEAHLRGFLRRLYPQFNHKDEERTDVGQEVGQ
jgi:hypothetical protein